MKRTIAGVVFLLVAALAVGQSGDSATSGSGNADRVILGADLLPFVGTSSAAPKARRLVSINLGGGLSGGIDLLELSSGFNISTGTVNGLQAAAGANVVVADLNAAQLAGGLNVSVGHFRGAQFAGGANAHVGDFVGLQTSPLNVATGDVDGVQLGVLNVARSSTASIGLVSILLDGFVDIEVFGTADGLLMSGIRHGGEYVYNVYYAGSPIIGNSGRFAFGLGLGARYQFSDAWEVSVDLTTTQVVEEWGGSNDNVTIEIRPLGSWRPNRFVALFAGPTVGFVPGESGAQVGAVLGLRFL